MHRGSRAKLHPHPLQPGRLQERAPWEVIYHLSCAALWPTLAPVPEECSRSKPAPSQLRLPLLGQLTAPEKGGRGRSLVPPLQLPMEWKENYKYSFTLFQPLSAPLFPGIPSSKKPVSTSSDVPHLLIRTAQTTQSGRCRSWSPELGPCFPSSMCVSLPESAPRLEQRRRPARLGPGLCPSYSQGG